MTQPPTTDQYLARDQGRPSSPGRPTDPRTTVVVVAGFATVLLAAVLALIPVPYAVYSPGPVQNVLGRQDGHPLITVKGHATYPTNGQLDLTTIYIDGGPGRAVNLLGAVGAWFDGSRAVLPVDLVFPPGVSQQTFDEEDKAMMVDSQQSAAAAAIREVGIAVPSTVRITEVEKTSPAAAVLRRGDVITAVNGKAVDDPESLRAAMSGVAAGASVPLTLRRGTTTTKVDARTYRAQDGRTVFGVVVQTALDLPFTVTISIDRVGGPSAGMMFALGIVDMLTPGPLTGGQRIAGTGAIQPDGSVEPIGGIQQKLVGARHAGATWFLAPADNCSEVRGHVPDGLRVVRTASLHQSVTSVRTIATGTPAQIAALPSC